MSKKKKIGMSGLNWFLSIIGILFFSSLIFLPPLFRAILKDDNPNLNKPIHGSQITEITICTKTEGTTDTEYIMNSSNDNLEMLAQTITTHHTEEANILETCNIEASYYQGLSGFHHSCRIDGNDMIVESRVQVLEYQDETIPIPFNVREKASTLKSSLMGSGFQCKTKKQ